MTLDEEIKKFESNAEFERTHENLRGCQEFKKLAEWLRELKALKAEPCEDAISREAALEAILTRVPDFCGGDEGGNLIGRNETASYIRNLPSVTPKQKTGEILTDYAIGIDREGFERKFVSTRYCSLCKCDLGYNADILTHYCPNCGAKLEYKGR